MWPSNVHEVHLTKTWGLEKMEVAGGQGCQGARAGWVD